jgi:hypothetical protein
LSLMQENRLFLEQAQAQGWSSPKERTGMHTTALRVEPQVARTAPPQVRTSAINTSGSSESRFRCIDRVNKPNRRESVPL